jgi:hypothetical protein
MLVAVSADGRQKGLRLMFVTGSGEALQLLRLIFDTPSHEGDERG